VDNRAVIIGLCGGTFTNVQHMLGAALPDAEFAEVPHIGGATD
jgi:hypothetical protein